MFSKTSLDRIRKSVKKTEREVKSAFGQRLRRIQRKGGSAGFDIDYVPELPALLDTPETHKMVFWCDEDYWDEIKPIGNEETGTGDNQIWFTEYSNTRWYPLYKPTSLTGVIPET